MRTYTAHTIQKKLGECGLNRLLTHTTRTEPVMFPQRSSLRGETTVHEPSLLTTAFSHIEKSALAPAMHDSIVDPGAVIHNQKRYTPIHAQRFSFPGDRADTTLAHAHTGHKHLPLKKGMQP